MSTTDRIYGCIFSRIPGGGITAHQERMEALIRALQSLPIEDVYPPLTRNLFSVTAHDYPTPGLHKELSTHFGLTVKDVADNWDVWLDKFEEFLKIFPWEQARLHLEFEQPPPGQRSTTFDYRWCRPARTPFAKDVAWEFHGGPREFGSVAARARELLNACTEHLNANPHDIASLETLARCLVRLRRYDELQLCIERLHQLAPARASSLGPVDE